jgi:hypothetical protein
MAFGAQLARRRFRSDVALPVVVNEILAALREDVRIGVPA